MQPIFASPQLSEQQSDTKRAVEAAVGIQRKGPIVLPFDAQRKEHFFTQALSFKHPAARDNRSLLPIDWKVALNFLQLNSERKPHCLFDFHPLILSRKQAMKNLCNLKSRFVEQQRARRKSLHPDLEKIIGHIDFPLMEHVVNLYKFSDSAILTQSAEGNPVVGEVEQGWHMPAKLVTASISISELTASAARRNDQV